MSRVVGSYYRGATCRGRDCRGRVGEFKYSGRVASDERREGEGVVAERVGEVTTEKRRVGGE